MKFQSILDCFLLLCTFIEGETGHKVCTGGSSVQKIQQMNALKTQTDKIKVYSISMTIAKNMFPQIQHWRAIVLQNLAPTLIKTQLPA